MTALCGGGTSAPNTGAAAIVDLGAGFAALLLAEASAGWLLPLIPFTGLAPLVLSTFCATDPPAQPTFTSGEADAILQLQVGTANWNSAIAKVGDTILNAAWYQFCHCTSAPMPVIGTAPAPPTGTPVFTPPIAGAGGPCLTFTPFTDAANHAGGWRTTFALPAGATSVRLTFKATQVGAGVHTTWSPGLAFGSNGATFGDQLPQTVSTFIAAGGSLVYSQLVEANTDFFLLSGFAGSPTSVDTLTVTCEVFCGSSGPADNASSGGLSTSESAVQDAILSMVTLIQRQLAPFASIAGTVHAGLTGSGALSVQGLVGVKVDVTTLPGYVGEIAGDPTELFDVGWFSWGSPDGYLERTFITHDPQLSIPAGGSICTSIGYSLNPGVVVTMTELLREP